MSSFADEFVRRQKEEKEKQRHRQRQAAALHTSHKATGVRDDDLKLKKQREEERQKKRQAQEYMQNHQGHEAVATQLQDLQKKKLQERQQQLEHEERMRQYSASGMDEEAAKLRRKREEERQKQRESLEYMKSVQLNEVKYKKKDRPNNASMADINLPDSERMKHDDDDLDLQEGNVKNKAGLFHHEWSPTRSPSRKEMSLSPESSPSKMPDTPDLDEDPMASVSDMAAALEGSDAVFPLRDNSESKDVYDENEDVVEEVVEVVEAEAAPEEDSKEPLPEEVGNGKEEAEEEEEEEKKSVSDDEAQQSTPKELEVEEDVDAEPLEDDKEPDEEENAEPTAEEEEADPTENDEDAEPPVSNGSAPHDAEEEEEKPEEEPEPEEEEPEPESIPVPVEPEPTKEEDPEPLNEPEPQPEEQPEKISAKRPLKGHKSKIRLDVLFSFGLLTSSDKPFLDNYMSAVEEVVKETLGNDESLTKHVRYDPAYGPFVQEYAKDATYHDAANRPNVQRVLVIAAIPIFLTNGISIKDAREGVCAGLQASMQDGSFIAIAKKGAPGGGKSPTNKDHP